MEHHKQLQTKSKVTEGISQPNMNSHLQLEERKADFPKEELIRLLSLLKSELQNKEIALASMKSEQLKRLINPIEISRSSLATAYMELQDRFKLLDQNNNVKQRAKAQLNRNTQDGVAIKSEFVSSEENDRECLNILSTLLELLDRHPLLALPRDTIYCLDYNCNELSTKNYLNIKIQQLDNLINQHRRFRYYMNEHLRRSEQRCLDLSREIELERSSKREDDKSFYNLTGKSVLLKHINQLKETLEIEKRNKQEIVMTLLNELLDEKERAESLSRKIAEQKMASGDDDETISREREKLVKLETELSNLAAQMKKQSSALTKERSDLHSRVVELEHENASLKTKLADYSKRMAELQHSNHEPSTHSSPSRIHASSKQVSPVAPTIRQTANAAITKSSTTPKTSTSSATNNLTKVALNRAQTLGKEATNGDQLSPKVSLLKSSSVSASSQPLRNLRTSISGGSFGSRTPSNQPKPQVPAKPAQLLDQQRNSKA